MVCGIRLIQNRQAVRTPSWLESSTRFTVKDTPSTVTEPL